ncbi:MAG TPA: crosslink repair DNA glycosylase YcaQ family protein [Blastocatellia bacterium]
MNGKRKHVLPPEIEEYRDLHWRREETLRVETAIQAEAFIERVGFTACMTDSRQPGPSLYIAVCGRRDAVIPHNVQKDPESSHTWMLKDEIVRRARVYYGKLARGKTMFIAPRMIAHFNAIWGVTKREEKKRLSAEALAILKALRKEWEMATSDLREESGVKDRKAFTRAIDELQAAMIVVPSDVVYRPKFSYIWTLAEARFPEQLAQKVERRIALREIARCFLDCAGMTYPGELAKVTGLSRPEAGLGNQALVKENITISPSAGSYIKSNLARALKSK